MRTYHIAAIATHFITNKLSLCTGGNETQAEEQTVNLEEEEVVQEEEAVQEEQEQTEEVVRAEAEQSAVKPLDEVLGQAQKAYAAYMEAEREVARIYRENEQQVADGEADYTEAYQPGEVGPDEYHALAEAEVPRIDATAVVTGHAGLIRDFVDRLRAGTMPETICTDNIKSLSMVFGAIDSADQGRRVELGSAEENL